MIVSFDLDDTLFVNPEKVSAEKPLHFPLSLIYRDRLRDGTRELLSELNKNNIEVWIYTTSYRSERYIRSLFSCYGIRIENIVNGARHMKEVQGSRKEAMPSKYPSKYRISLHVDDDASVAENGRTYGFNVYLINDGDSEWVKNIRREIQALKAKTGES